MNINHHDITVVIPAYNCENSILNVIYAINNQTYVNYISEIIIVNDGSTDNTLSILNSIKNNSIVPLKIIDINNSGVSKARNIGLSNVKSKWVALCDSDDVWFTDKIEHQVTILNSNDYIDFLGGNHFPGDQFFLLKRINKLTKISTIFLCFKVLPQTSTSIFKTEILQTVTGFDENQRYAEDGNFFMKISKFYNCYFDPKQVLCYGNGKSGYGVSGLSANIKCMHKGLIKNLIDMYSLGYINTFIFVVSYLFEYFKYFIRLLKVKFKII